MCQVFNQSSDDISMKFALGDKYYIFIGAEGEHIQIECIFEFKPSTGRSNPSIVYSDRYILLSDRVQLVFGTSEHL